jgi:hypothetical protein
MNYYTKEVSKEFYEKCQKETGGRGFVPSKFYSEIFTIPQMCGYGIYGTNLYKKDDKYYVHYDMGSSCD